MVASYEQLKNKQTELIRKALEGSVFIGDISVPAITTLTEYSATATAGQIDGTGSAVAIGTGGNLVLNIKGTDYTVALAAADALAAVVTKVNAVISAVGTASDVSGVLRVVTVDTGSDATIKVVSGTGTVLADLFLVAGQKGFGKDAGVNLKVLPAGMDDLGWLSGDGAQFSRDVSTSDVTSWGSVTPTRSDVTSDTSTMAVTAQETKLLTIGLATGADLAAITADAQTASGQLPTAAPWAQRTQLPPPKPTLHLAILVDLSGSMQDYAEELSSAAWIFAHAARRSEAVTTTIGFGSHTSVLVAPTARPQKVLHMVADQDTSTFPEAVKVADRLLDLRHGRTLRMLVVVSDGRLADIRAGQKLVTTLHQAGCVVLWLQPAQLRCHTFTDATTLTVADPADAVTHIANAAITALEHA